MASDGNAEVKDAGGHAEAVELSTMPAVVRTNSHLDEGRVDISWRSWTVVFVTSFAIMAQVFVVVAAGQVIAFIIRDLGNAPIAGWIIQGPLLMQAVLAPIVGRLSDVLDRKWLATIPPLIAFAGAAISATASSMPVLIAGGILIGTTLSTISIVQAIPAEVLPLKWRAIANGAAYFGGAFGGLFGTLGAGGVTNASASGWRHIFWIQAAFHLASALGLLAFYRPLRRSDFPKMSLKEYLWLCDPIGSVFYIGGATSLLLAFDWAAGAYLWSDSRVAAPLAIGWALMAAFAVYEWKGRSDGLVAHVFFQGSHNFALSCFAFFVEGWIFYSAVNSVTTQIVLNLGFEDNSWSISIRQMSYTVPTLLVPMPIIWYSTKYKDLKSPLIVCFLIFLAVTICYATITPQLDRAQIGYNVLSGFGQSGPLTLIVALVQFTAPHAYLSTATGLAFSFRAIGGAFGSAILDAIISGKLAGTWAPQVGAAATAAGLPQASVPDLLAALQAGDPALIEAVKGATPATVGAATDASHWAYARAYNVAWASIAPFVLLALVAVACLSGVKELMTEHVEATVEKASVPEKGQA